MGWQIPGYEYTFFCGGGTNRPTAYTLVRSANTWMLPRLSFGDLVVLFIKYKEGEV